ncbi:MAG: hypothetical protein M1833_005553 [Piccolia ochrophora]|nr:MAG: hypothetical protein M1833_005553 [Piccolia ochrophora]
MCIVLLSTAHPEYPLILLDNRDEYLNRPTAPAAFWEAPNSHVLGGYDLLRAEHGTWLGVTRQGRIAVLTNFREEEADGSTKASGPRSRGAMVNAWLKLPPNSQETTETFVRRLFDEGEGVRGVGGFSLLCGQLKRTEGGGVGPFAIVSNRTPDPEAIPWIGGSRDEVHGLSNTLYGDPWPKVKLGEELLRNAVVESVRENENKDLLLERLFSILTVDSMPKMREGSVQTYTSHMSKSIFIPAVGGGSANTSSAEQLAASQVEGQAHVVDGTTTDGKDSMSPLYGTQKQTVILMDKQGAVTFIERTLYDQSQHPVPVKDRDARFDFEVERIGQ